MKMLKGGLVIALLVGLGGCAVYPAVPAPVAAAPAYPAYPVYPAAPAVGLDFGFGFGDHHWRR
jgi:hypothetical protein